MIRSQEWTSRKKNRQGQRYHLHGHSLYGTSFQVMTPDMSFLSSWNWRRGATEPCFKSPILVKPYRNLSLVVMKTSCWFPHHQKTVCEILKGKKKYVCSRKGKAEWKMESRSDEFRGHSLDNYKMVYPYKWTTWAHIDRHDYQTMKSVLSI